MTKRKILIVEDDEILSKVVREELEDNGFEVFQAFDGEQGLKMAKERKSDLVLLDVMIPKMNGFEVLVAIKKDFNISNIPIFMLTALGSDDDVKKGFKLGANDYIVKSQHSVSEIVGKIKNFFNNYAEISENKIIAEAVDKDKIKKTKQSKKDFIK